MASCYELKIAKDGQFHFNLKAGNGQIILGSELYKTRASAENGIASVQKNGIDPSRFETKESKAGKPYFVLKAANGQVIGQSEYYESATACQNGIESVIKNAATETVKDSTASA